MPLFECSKCHVVDNTALGNFWWNVMHEGKPALCAECDPEIGQWHGAFERMSYADYIARFGKHSVQYPATAKAADTEACSTCGGRGDSGTEGRVEGDCPKCEGSGRAQRDDMRGM